MPEAINLTLGRAKLPDGPYPGLRPFEPHEWSIFFGREVMTADVISRLGRQNLIIVHGASGCGKSSLVRAGVLPVLQSDHELNRREFRYSVIRPSQGPLEALAAALLAQLGPVNGRDLEESWLDRIAIDQDLVGTIEQRLQGTNATFCLVIDQFEEIFRWAEERDRAEAEFIVDFIRAAAGLERGHRNFFVLVTMRSDYLGQCAQFRDFAGVVNDCQYLLDNLDEFGILRAIHEPAERFSGSVDPALADRLRFMAKDDADALPILQHTLMRMYDALPSKEPGWTLGLTALAGVSGETGPLSEHAEAIYQEVTQGSPECAAAVEWMFRALTDLDSGGRAIRRPCRFEELVAVSGADEETVGEIVDAFSRSGRNFLVVTPSEHGAREVDVSHEALIRRWRRIGDNSMDPDSGLRVGWLFREFQAGLIWKALAVFANRGESTIEPTMTQQWLGFFDQVAGRPTWAARYFVDPVPGVSPEKQPEWSGVMALIAASKARLKKETNAWRRVLIRSWAYLLLVAALLVGAGVVSYLQLRDKASAAEAKAARSDTLFRQADARAVVATRLSESATRQSHEAAALTAQAQADTLAAKRSATLAAIEAHRQRAAARQAQQLARASIAEQQRIAQTQLEGTQAEIKQMEMVLAAYGHSVEEFAQDADDQRNSIRVHPRANLPVDFRSEMRSLIREMGAPESQAALWAEQIESLRAEYQVTTDRRLAAFLAAIALQTNNFQSVDEQLDFASAEAVRERFPQLNEEEAAGYVHRPRELANRLYHEEPVSAEEHELDGIIGTRSRTGNTGSDDGWIYRGRGLIVARGRNVYQELGEALHEDFLARPELINDPRYLVRAALELWRRREGNDRADTENLLSVARRIAHVDVNGERILPLEMRARTLIARALEKTARGQ